MGYAPILRLHETVAHTNTPSAVSPLTPHTHKRMTIHGDSKRIEGDNQRGN